MACAELLMMALLAALKRNNITSEPIVMWLGNSSSPPRLLPWSSIGKPGAGLSKNQPPGLQLIEPEIQHFFPSPTKKGGSGSQFRKPPFKKGWQSQQKKKGGRGPGKNKKKGKGKKRKWPGKPNRKRRPQVSTPRKAEEEKEASPEPKKTTARGGISTTSENKNKGGTTRGTTGRHHKSTTGKHKGHHNTEGGRHVETEKPGGGQRGKKTGKVTTPSLLWTALKELSSMLTTDDRDRGSNQTRDSGTPTKLTSKHHKPTQHKHVKGHSRSTAHKTTVSTAPRRSTPVTSKATGASHKGEDTNGKEKHKKGHGRPSASPHHRKTTLTQPLTPSSSGVTKKDRGGLKSTKKEKEDSSQRGSSPKPSSSRSMKEKAGGTHSTKMYASSQSHGGRSKGRSKSTPEFEATVDLTTGQTKQHRKTPSSSSLTRESASPSSRSSGGKSRMTAVSVTPKSGTESGSDKKSSRGTKRRSVQTTPAEKAEGSSTTPKSSKARRRRRYNHIHRHFPRAHRNRHKRKGSRGTTHSRPKLEPQRAKFRAADDDEEASKDLSSMLRTVPLKSPE